MVIAEAREGPALAECVPGWARQVLVVGDVGDELVASLEERPGVNNQSVAGDADLSSFEGEFDCILLDRPEHGLAALGQAAARLAQNGMLLLRVRNPCYFRGDVSAGSSREEVEQQAAQAGLAVYDRWPEIDKIAHEVEPGPDVRIELGGRTYRVASEEDRERLFAIEYVFALVRPRYNPVEHAHELFKAGRPDWCYEVLEGVPAAYLDTPGVAATVYADMQYCKATLAERDAPARRLRYFFEAQVLFYRVVSRVPDFREAYHTQAELWRRVGDDAMAARLLRSLQRVAADQSTQRLIESLGTARTPEAAEATTLEWTPGARRPRVLMIMTPGRPHFGMDVLYDGLCTVLGDDHVVEFPWKPTLHGQAAKDQANYPCLFDRPGEPLELAQVLAELRGNRFDCVLFCDLEHKVEVEPARQLMQAAEDLPLFIVDVQDDPADNRADVLAFLGRDTVSAYFKREMLACHDYGPDVFPFPFAYPDGRVPADVSGTRPEPLFWAGHRRFGLRRLYLERLEAVLKMPFDKTYSPEEYLEALRRARIGLSFFGFGYDTVRYWEVPAQGCMLLAEQLPIRIPHNFRDGASAVFFDDAKDLEEKLGYYLTRPADVAAIATAGHAHLKAFHTASVRARQLLGWMHAVLRG